MNNERRDNIIDQLNEEVDYEYYYDDPGAAGESIEYWKDICRELLGLEEKGFTLEESEEVIECPDLGINVTFTKDYKISVNKR